MLKNSEFIWKCRFRCVSVVRSGCSEISLVQVESLFGKLGGQTSILSIKRRSIVTNSCSKTPDSFQTDFSVYFESAQVDNFRQLSTTFRIRDHRGLDAYRNQVVECHSGTFSGSKPTKMSVKELKMWPGRPYSTVSKKWFGTWALHVFDSPISKLQYRMEFHV